VPTIAIFTIEIEHDRGNPWRYRWKVFQEHRQETYLSTVSPPNVKRRSMRTYSSPSSTRRGAVDLSRYAGSPDEAMACKQVGR
jgi:hypothetical protein